MDTYLININIKLYFWIFIFPFCFDLVKFFSVTLTSDVLQRIVRLFLRGSEFTGSLRLASSVQFSPAATHWRVLRGCWSEELKGSSVLSLCIFQNEHGQMKWIREDYLFFLLSLGYLLDFRQHFEVIPEVALVKRLGTSAVPHAHDLTHFMCRVMLAKCHIYCLVAIDLLFRVTQFVGAEQKKKITVWRW